MFQLSSPAAAVSSAAAAATKPPAAARVSIPLLPQVKPQVDKQPPDDGWWNISSGEMSCDVMRTGSSCCFIRWSPSRCILLLLLLLLSGLSDGDISA
jgi:hypothetical protein